MSFRSKIELLVGDLLNDIHYVKVSHLKLLFKGPFALGDKDTDF